MLAQQSARLIFKNVEKAAQGKECKTIFSYFNKFDELLSKKSSAKTVEEFLTYDNLFEALSVKAAYSIKETYTMIKATEAPKKTKDNEMFASDVVIMTRNHLHHTMVGLAKQRVEGYDFKDKNITPHIELLLKIFAVN